VRGVYGGGELVGEEGGWRREVAEVPTLVTTATAVNSGRHNRPDSYFAHNNSAGFVSIRTPPPSPRAGDGVARWFCK
jgi:hypothetical protein